VTVLGGIALIASLAGAVDTTETDWNKTAMNIGLMSSTGVLMLMLTEEGFFRGWLWGALKRGGLSDTQVLIWTAATFTLWHLSAITLDTGFDVPAAEVPIYLVNAMLLGVVWGLARMISGSIVPAAVSHALWNGLDYPLYGFGEKTGALGIEQTHIYGPEVGLVGIAFNAIFVAVLVRWCKSRR
jgi:membrane protease YdiL (CAAX protease family)